MSKHTPGPWRYQRDKEGTGFVAHSYVWGPKVTVHCAGGDLNHAEPDMRLIAAAPDLLDALQLCEGNIASLLASAHPRVYGEWLTVVRAAIAKATGEVK